MGIKKSELVPAALIVAFILAVIVIGFYPSVRNAPRDRCLANLKTIATGLSIYTGEAEGLLPPAAIWADALVPNCVESPSSLVCPQAQPGPEELERVRSGGKRGVPIGYALLKTLAQQRVGTVYEPEKLPLVFDSTVFSANAVADADTLAFRHVGKTAGVCFADGHVKAITELPPPPSRLFKTPEEIANEEAAEHERLMESLEH